MTCHTTSNEERMKKNNKKFYEANNEHYYYFDKCNFMRIVGGTKVKLIKNQLGGHNMIFTGNIAYKLPEACIFVFGSNPQGEHGPVTAEIAKKYFGAIEGQSEGLQGNSYGIVTVSLLEKCYCTVSGDYYPTYKLTRGQMIKNFRKFTKFVNANPGTVFLLAYKKYKKDGKKTVNLCGYNSDEIIDILFTANDFEFVPKNLVLDADLYQEYVRLWKNLKALKNV